MKCPICNGENPPEAKTCQACGFSLDIEQPTWPELPEVQFPEVDQMVEWPEVPAVELPSEPADSVPPAEVPSVDVEERIEEIPAVDDFSEDDRLAMVHIKRGEDALREGLPDQAEWEFEQAQHLAEDPETTRLAERHLAELRTGPSEDEVRVWPVEEKAEPPPDPQRSITPPTSSTARPPSLSQFTSAASLPLPTLQLALILGVVNGILTGIGVACCLGLLVTPILAFLAGRMMIRDLNRQRQEATIGRALLMGGIVGLGGAVGEMIALPLWLSPRFTTDVSPQVLVPLACTPAIFLVLLGAAAGGLGWRAATRSQE